jgi:hypothetical protein
MSRVIENLLQQVEADTEEKTSVASAERSFDSEADASTKFQQLGEKLLRIERWNHSSGVSSFAPYDENGDKMPNAAAAEGYFISIKLPGTGKEDWVKITDIYKSSDEMVLTVQPTFDPTEKTPDESVTSHFFTDKSSNNFCLGLNGAKISMYVIGLNEVSNTKDTSGIIESVRNYATANLGHFLGFQKAEWTTFCENFLEIESKT